MMRRMSERTHVLGVLWYTARQAGKAGRSLSRSLSLYGQDSRSVSSRMSVSVSVSMPTRCRSASPRRRRVVNVVYSSRVQRRRAQK
jgi:hypothetical protein